MPRGLICILMTLGVIGAIGLVTPGCGDDEVTKAPPVSSLSYRGHENDSDSNNLVVLLVDPPESDSLVIQRLPRFACRCLRELRLPP